MLSAEELELGLDDDFIHQVETEEDLDIRTREEKILDGDLPLPEDQKIVEGKVEFKSNRELYRDGLLTKEQYSVLKRSERDYELQNTDKYVLPDFPITDAELSDILKYRQYLRDAPASLDNWPDVDIPSLEDYLRRLH